VFHIAIWGAKPTKSPRGDGTADLSKLHFEKHKTV